MSLTTAPKLIGSRVLFFREGDAFSVPSAGTCSATAQPGAADPGWIELGKVVNCRINSSGAERREVYGPSPGALRRLHVLHTKRDVDYVFTINFVSPLALEMLFGSEALTGGTGEQFNPGERPDLNGWLHIEHYDSEDAAQWTDNMWCNVEVSDATLDPSQEVTLEITARRCYSALNSGAFA